MEVLGYVIFLLNLLQESLFIFKTTFFKPIITHCTRGKANSLHNIIAVKYLFYPMISFKSFTS
ncbi:hypothetical protein J2S02_002605 [Metabacillus niabensis]|uniref:Uncharacterized protein n=1 Tax=Metabacillus niabensis TaxID=324854 RepID=A0ABT9Z2M6_9BACI|nr:hypothetical protein [Metabacillus niabensis]